MDPYDLMTKAETEKIEPPKLAKKASISCSMCRRGWFMLSDGRPEHVHLWEQDEK